MRLLLVLLLSVLLGGCGYNTIQQKDEAVDAAWSQVLNVYKRRADLVPNLVATVRGYAAHEQQVLTDVTEARASAVAAGAQGNVAQMGQAENALTGALRSLFAVVENYPDLKANQNVLSLQEELTTTENQISFSRQHYNASVLEYNNAIQVFPNVLLAGMFGFTKREFFEAEPEAANVPTVDLSLS